MLEWLVPGKNTKCPENRGTKFNAKKGIIKLQPDGQ